MDGYRSLNPISKKSKRIGYLIVTALLAVVTVLFFVFRDTDPSFTYAAAVFAALTVIMAVISAVFPVIFYNHYRYIITDDRVEVVRGIIFLRHTLVPIERIHQVEVVSGPVNRTYGLSDVHITTAGGTASIDFLENEEADRIAEELNRIVGNIIRSQKDE